jgi:hypothetical protein
MEAINEVGEGAPVKLVGVAASPSSRTNQRRMLTALAVAGALAVVGATLLGGSGLGLEVANGGTAPTGTGWGLESS